jgi:hypothetical protein
MKKYSHDWWQSLRPEVAGSETEKLVESLLDQENTRRLDFAWHRFPDSKAAGRVIAAQPSDYLVANGKRTFLLEVKATNHAYRLAKDKVRQLAVMHKFDAASTKGVIVVNHYMDNLWRCFRATDLELGKPSWDLRGFPTFPSAELALSAYL